MNLTARCYAYGSGEDWEAICTDFNIAVDGKSLQAVKESLNICIEMYLEQVAEFSEEEQRRFLTRRSPLHVRAKWVFRSWLCSIGRRSQCQGFTFQSHLPALP